MREKLIELLKGVKYTVFPNSTDLYDFGIQHSDHVFQQVADHLLANGVTMQNWIPVTEHTAPERFVNVLCYFPQKDYGSKTQVSYNEREKGGLPYFSEQHQWGAPSHWMSLPEAPKEDA